MLRNNRGDWSPGVVGVEYFTLIYFISEMPCKPDRRADFIAIFLQGLNSRLEWGVLGDENSWKQPIASWFGLWWKSFVATSEPQHDTILPPQLLLHEAAKAKNSQTAMGQKPSMPKGVALEKILPAASAGCGRATAVLSEKERSPQGLGPDSVNAETLRCVASQSLAELPRQ